MWTRGVVALSLVGMLSSCGGELPFGGPGTYRYEGGGLSAVVSVPAPEGHRAVEQVESFRRKIAAKREPTYVLLEVHNQGDGPAELPAVSLEFDDASVERIESASALVEGWAVVGLPDPLGAEAKNLAEALEPSSVPPDETAELLLAYDGPLPEFAYLQVGEERASNEAA